MGVAAHLDVRARTRTRPRLSAPAILLVPAAIVVTMGWLHRWVSDDAFIDLRVVHNLLNGHGPVFNPGERVEAYTSPLWVGLLAALKTVLRPVPLEWLAVVAGLAATGAGMVAAGWAAEALAREERGRGPYLPLGALVVAAIPAFWDFATSGLETGMAFAWLGGCFAALVAVRRRTAEGRPATPPIRWTAVLIGVGPLVRPDFLVITAVFLAALVVVAGPRPARATAGLLATAAALPAAYEVFRMGYFAALVPTTALAKEATHAHWAQGWHYLRDLLGTYWLAVPVVVLLTTTAARVGRRWDEDRPGAVLLAAPVAGGLLHGLYVVRVGGDFMHARMLLPSLFCLLLPAFVVAVPRRPRMRVVTALVLVWAAVCAVGLRAPFRAIATDNVENERDFYAYSSGSAHPVTVADLRRSPLAVDARRLRQLAAGHPHAVLLVAGRRADGTPELVAVRAAAAVRADLVSGGDAVGLAGYIVGDDVHLVDRLGLSDPLAARLAVATRGRPGHEKRLDQVWIAARFADPDAPVPATVASADALAAARQALACGDLHELLTTDERPLSVGGFFRNLTRAWRFDHLRVPVDPFRARDRFCGPTSGR